VFDPAVNQSMQVPLVRNAAQAGRSANVHGIGKRWRLPIPLTRPAAGRNTAHAQDSKMIFRSDRIAGRQV
jgi:hypothetical protein